VFGKWRAAGIAAGVSLIVLSPCTRVEGSARQEENASEACTDCHGDPGLAGPDTAGVLSLYVPALPAASVHSAFECADCHSGITSLPHPEELPKVVCATCHVEEQAEYDLSIHSRADREDAPACTDCHGTHDIRAMADSASLVHPARQALTCSRCHSDPLLVKKYRIPIPNPLLAYQSSVHGELTARGEDAATCASCHGSHRVLAAGDSNSSVARANIPGTCGRCHEEISAQYVESVHGVAVLRGSTDAPDCNDCHSEHGIKGARSEGSPTAPDNLSTQTCGRCHSSTRLEQKYGLAVKRVSSFENSYHGLALRSGNLLVANCASCHGVHNILPSSDPRSMVAPVNLRQTCGQCHTNAAANFAAGPVHMTGDEGPDKVNATVKNLYIVLIVSVIGGMAIHNGLDFARRSRDILKKR
jgi:hypothetical protein